LGASYDFSPSSSGRYFSLCFDYSSLAASISAVAFSLETYSLKGGYSF